MEEKRAILVENQEMYEKLTNTIKGMHMDIHAIYEPDGSHIFGDCYCAAVDLFSWQFTFRVYFKITEAGEIDVQDVSRWHFG